MCYASLLFGITGVCIRLFRSHMQLLLECLRIGSLHYWQCSIWITMMQRQLWDSQTMTHYSKSGQLLTRSTQNFRTSTHQKNSWLSMRQYAHFKGVYSFMFISKESPTDMESKCLNVVRQKVAMSTTWKYIMGHIPPTQKTTRCLVLLTGCVTK